MGAIDTWKVVSRFSQQGEFAKNIPNYQVRDGQVEMAEGVAEAFNQREIAVIEGGTGIGKSFGYLVPAIHWILDNPKDRVVVSTATIHLQQQLVEKDIPFVLKVLGASVQYALLKGRGNYLCKSRLVDEVRQGDMLFGESFKKLMDWSGQTEDGSYSSVPFQVSPSLWDMVCSDGALCLGKRCGHGESCFFMKAKERAEKSSLIVVNNHLLFADIISSDEDNRGVIIPNYHHIIFDEAHNMEESGISLFTESLSRGQLIRTFRRVYGIRDKRKGSLLRTLEQIVPKKSMLEDIPELIWELYRALQNIEGYIQGILPFYNDSDTTIERSFSDLSQDILATLFDLLTQFSESGRMLQRTMFKAVVDLPKDIEESREILEWNAIIDQVSSYSELAQRFIHFEEERDYWVAWIRREEAGATLFYTPIDISEILRERVFHWEGSTTCVSATLRVQDSFDFWFRQVGLHEKCQKKINTYHFASPFLYKEQVDLLIPTDTPDQSDSQYIPFLLKTLDRLISREEGGVLVLFTSYAMLHRMYEKCVDRGYSKPILKQGDSDRFSLIQQFKQEPSILFATSSFWEGVDIPGDSLKLLIITKLPFAVPSTPIHRARSEKITKEGHHPFGYYFLPQAILKLRQGFGRLIRNDQDSGTVAILDSRIVTKGYGSLFIRDLPSCNTRVDRLELL